MGVYTELFIIVFHSSYVGFSFLWFSVYFMFIYRTAWITE